MSERTRLKAPFVYFGGKGKVARVIWERFGDVRNLIEPFCGSAAVLLARPELPESGSETINDIDGFIVNAYRSIRHDPATVAEWTDWPVSECDLTARHLWLLKQKPELIPRLMADPDYYDAKIAGWWLWGAACWIGSGWCSGKGPWIERDGKLCRRDAAEEGAEAPRPTLRSGAQGVLTDEFQASAGVPRKMPYLRDGVNGGVLSEEFAGVKKNRPEIKGAKGVLSEEFTGVNRKPPHLTGRNGINSPEFQGFEDSMFFRLARRLKRVRICCGDWKRVLGNTPLYEAGTPAAVFLDPPYRFDEREPNLYAHETDCTEEVRQWAIENGEDRRLRICVAGYDAPGYEFASTWECVSWKAPGGYGSQGNGRGRDNQSRERLWFSPHCLKASPKSQLSLFDE